MLISMLAAVAPAAAPPPVVIVNPGWLKKPDSNDLRAAWPVNALRRNIGGKADLHCIVNIHGLLEHCNVVSETPLGLGFGAAALLLTPNFLMTPGTRNGVPFPSAVNIPIHFDAQGRDVRRDLPESPIYDEMVGVTHAIWQAAPTFDEVGRAYPKAAGGLSGHVVLRCKVAKTGALGDCITLTEEPRGKGFERAARTLLPGFRMRMDAPILESRRPVYVSLPIRLIDPASEDFRKRRIGDPTWTVTPDPAKVAHVFPEAAIAAGVKSGRGVAECSVAADGSLTGCSAVAGQPEGLGFSQSAVLVAAIMRMNLWTEEGGPVDGTTIRLPIRFNLAADTPAAVAAAPAH